MIYPAFMVGLALHFQPQLFDTSSAYGPAARWFEESTWALLFFVIVALRLVALIVNGTFAVFRWAPHIRLAVSILSAMAWSQLCFCFAILWIEDGRATFLTIMLSSAVLMEIINAFRASRDLAEGGRVA
ncbi:MAG TPA: hypothetical protein DIT40_08250 [Alphaproteobacteria bacterium]|nr:hypothetical protein [Alphaproteobacteria bacterium]